MSGLTAAAPAPAALPSTRQPPRAWVQQHDFSVDALAEQLRGGGGGAIVTFVGTVRATAEGAAVDHLQFEAYGAMATAVMEALIDRALARFDDVVDARLVHRLGTLAVGDNIVAVAVAAGHRDSGFEAARWLIDRLKEEVPIWKKEVSGGVGRWKEVRSEHP